MSNRHRIDSASAAVEVAQSATFNIVPPDHIPLIESDAPFWNSIIAEKAKVEWTAHDLEIAALLARSLRKMGQEEQSLDCEGSVVTTTGGNVAQNPRCRVIADLHSRIIKYRQTLGIHDRGKNGEARDVEKRREIARTIENGVASGFDDNLLAGGPSIQ